MRITFATFCLVVASAAHADPCDALYNASIKSLQTPHHVLSTSTRAGKTRTSEAIYAGGVEYVLINGSWKRSPMTITDMVEAAQDKLKTHPDVCTAKGENTVDGQAVDVYAVHSKEAETDQEVRVSKSTGLMQGSTAKLPGGNVLETRYDYTDVRAPAM